MGSPPWSTRKWLTTHQAHTSSRCCRAMPRELSLSAQGDVVDNNGRPVTDAVECTRLTGPDGNEVYPLAAKPCGHGRQGAVRGLLADDDGGA